MSAEPAFALCPPWVADLDSVGVRTVIYVVTEWTMGRSPSVRAVMRVGGWGWERTASMMHRLWEESGEVGAPRPCEPYWTRGPDPTPEPDGPDGLFEHPGHLTHADVVSRAVRWLRGYHRCSPAYGELVVAGTPVIPDAIGFRDGWSVLIEAKVSRSDFKADKHKPIHSAPHTCPGQERWYLTPPGLLFANEIPDGWGLAEVGARSVRIRLEPTRGEACPGRAKADIRLLAAAVRRHEVGAKWDHDGGRFAPCSPVKS